MNLDPWVGGDARHAPHSPCLECLVNGQFMIYLISGTCRRQSLWEQSNFHLSYRPTLFKDHFGGALERDIHSAAHVYRSICVDTVLLSSRPLVQFTYMVYLCLSLLACEVYSSLQCSLPCFIQAVQSKTTETIFSTPLVWDRVHHSSFRAPICVNI